MSDFILLGYITRPFGIKGGVFVKLLNPNSAYLTSGLLVHVLNSDGLMTSLSIEKTMGNARFLFKEVISRDAAEALRGTKIFIKREDLPEPEDDEFYFTDLIGAQVEDITGEIIGKVSGFSSNNAQHLIDIITVDDKTLSIPMIKPIVQKIDVHNKKIMVDLPEGLLDLRT